MKRVRICCLVLASLLFFYIIINPITTDAASKVRLDKSVVTLNVGSYINLRVVGTTNKVTWTSSNKKVATVTSAGVVSAVAKGKATIKACVNKKTYTCKVTVNNPIRISRSIAILTQNMKTTLKMLGTTKKVTWYSSDKKIATVSSKGVVTGKGIGVTTIKAKVGKKTYTCELTVRANEISIYDYSNEKSWYNVSICDIQHKFVQARPVRLTYDGKRNLVADICVYNFGEEPYDFKNMLLRCFSNNNLIAEDIFFPKNEIIPAKSYKVYTITFDDKATLKYVDLPLEDCIEPSYHCYWYLISNLDDDSIKDLWDAMQENKEDR